MRNSSWMDWFGAEVGFSIYIHRRGFTTSSSSPPPPRPQLPLPRRVGAARRSGLRALRVRARELAPTRWATPPYRGHKAKFAPCETPPGWIGLVLKLDSLYIYIGGVSPPPPPTATNHCSCLPRRAGAPRARAPHAPYAYAQTLMNAHTLCTHITHTPYAHTLREYA